MSGIAGGGVFDEFPVMTHVGDELPVWADVFGEFPMRADEGPADVRRHDCC